jgi:hypothetical protein
MLILFYNIRFYIILMVPINIYLVIREFEAIDLNILNLLNE